jgi:type III pantothenate kinase
MLLAIDLGNTHTVYGLHDGREWRSVWRRSTDVGATEDELAVWLKGLHELQGLSMDVNAVVCGSVVPSANDAVERLSRKWLGCEPLFLSAREELGLPILYSPASAVGADRIANALGALEKYAAPLVVVDFGTATTFDAISREGEYVGGAILPGIETSSKALFEKAAKLPPVEYVAPNRAIGRNTVESLQSGIVLGYAGAIDALATRISGELGGATVLATGGLSGMFLSLCATLQHHEPHLTLDGLRIGYNRLRG